MLFFLKFGLNNFASVLEFKTSDTHVVIGYGQYSLDNGILKMHIG